MKLELAPELYQKVEKAYRWFLDVGLISASEYTVENFACGMLEMSVENYAHVMQIEHEQDVEKL